MSDSMQQFLLASSLLLAAALPAKAVTVAVSPASQTVGLGGTVLVDVVASDLGDGAAPSIAAYDFDLSYDPSVLGFVDVTFGTGLDVLGLGGNPRTVDAGLPGVVDVAEISLDSETDLDLLQPGSFTLFTVTFTALATGTSPLGLTLQGLSDAAGGGLGASLAGGQASVVPLPAAAWLLAAGFAGLVGLGRRDGNA